MLDRQELAELISKVQIQSPRQSKQRRLAIATLFAGQVIVCTLILQAAYFALRAPGVNWAIISAVLVLQPGIAQSLSASAVRIAANLIGAITGLLIGYSLGTGWPQILAGMVAVIFICEPLRLDYGLRTACVSVIIVMTANGGIDVLTASFDRFVAVVAGCGLALLVQLLADRIREQLGWGDLLAPPPTATGLSPVATQLTAEKPISPPARSEE